MQTAQNTAHMCIFLTFRRCICSNACNKTRRFVKFCFLYAVIVAVGLFLSVEQIRKRHGIEVVAYDLVKTSPERQRCAGRASLALIGFMIETGNRRDASLGYSENIADGIFIRTFCESVSSLKAAVGKQDIGFIEHWHYLFEVFL